MARHAYLAHYDPAGHGAAPISLEPGKAHELFPAGLRGLCRASRRNWRLVAEAELSRRISGLQLSQVTSRAAYES